MSLRSALQLTYTTVARNTAATGGGGVRNEDALQSLGTIIAANSGGDCSTAAPGVLTSQGYNLDDDGSCALTCGHRPLARRESRPRRRPRRQWQRGAADIGAPARQRCDRSRRHERQRLPRHRRAGHGASDRPGVRHRRLRGAGDGESAAQPQTARLESGRACPTARAAATERPAPRRTRPAPVATTVMG